MSLEEIFALAEHWRQEQQGMDERAKGFVVLFNGAVAGWKSNLEDAEGWMPGCLAVGTTRSVFCATGGNCFKGAERWELYSGQFM